MSAPNKSGRKDLGKTQHVPQYPDEALAIDIENAKAFIKKHHEATAIAKKYVDTWQKAMSNNA